jgi:hypothetical protein
MQIFDRSLYIAVSTDTTIMLRFKWPHQTEQQNQDKILFHHTCAKTPHKIASDNESYIFIAQNSLGTYCSRFWCTNAFMLVLGTTISWVCHLTNCYRCCVISRFCHGVVEASLFWDVMPSMLAVVCRCFVTACQSHLQGPSSQTRQNWFAAPKTSVNNYQ